MTLLSNNQIWQRKPKTWRCSCTSLLAEAMCCTPGLKTCQIFEVAVGVLAMNHIRLYMSARQPHVWERVDFDRSHLPKNPLKWRCSGLCVFPTAHNSATRGWDHSIHSSFHSRKQDKMKTASVDLPFKPVCQIKTFGAQKVYLNPKVLPPELRRRLVKSTEETSAIFGFRLVYVFLNGSILVWAC